MTRRQAVLQVAQTQRLLADRLDLRDRNPSTASSRAPAGSRTPRTAPCSSRTTVPANAADADTRQASAPARSASADPEKDPPSTPGSLTPTQTHASKGPATATSTPAVDVTRKTIRPRPDASRAAPAAHQPGFSSSKDVAARRQLLFWFPRGVRLSALARRCPCDNKGRSRQRPLPGLGTTAPRLHRPCRRGARFPVRLGATWWSHETADRSVLIGRTPLGRLRLLALLTSPARCTRQAR